MDLRSRFGFHTTPFTRELAVEQCFRLPFLDEALAALQGCVERRMSGALIAPAGSGKTSILRRLCHALPEARYEPTYIKVTGVSKRDMCRELCRACGAPPAGSFPAMVEKLQERFTQAYGQDGRRPVVILDEAHDLRPDVLAMLRILTNFDMDSRLVVSVVLVGQPPLRRMLARDDQEDVARRLAHIASLRLLSREETGRYIEHRCTVAGSATVPFDEASQDALYELGRGNLRATDCLALEALLLCDRQDHDVVDARHVAAARKNLWP